jgi:hypothetical protein
MRVVEYAQVLRLRGIGYSNLSGLRSEVCLSETAALDEDLDWNKDDTISVTPRCRASASGRQGGTYVAECAQARAKGYATVVGSFAGPL